MVAENHIISQNYMQKKESEKIQAFADKYHKKRTSPCGQCTFGVHNPKFFPKKKRRKKTK